jgi:hypothetical protein
MITLSDRKAGKAAALPKLSVGADYAHPMPLLCVKKSLITPLMYMCFLIAITQKMFLFNFTKFSKGKNGHVIYYV